MTLGRKGNSIKDFISKIEIDINNCWCWQGEIDKDGYGVFYFKGKTYRAHRWSYTYFECEIQDNLTIDHLCNNRPCVNPDHLKPATIKDNVLRSVTGISAINARKTYCKYGHKFNKDNTGIGKNGQRYCKKCKRITSNKHYRKKYGIENL